MTVIKLNAGLDKNGNPRRLFVGMKPEGVVWIADEGYGGVPKHLTKGAYVIMDIDITPAEYKRLIRYANHRGIYHAS